MPLIAPILDDRGFEELRGELVNRIRVYNPEWTDYNRSDAAITLLELFAYLGEGLQFRFNQIPEATQLAFLRLLGMPLRPAQTASVLARATTQSQAGVVVYAGDQLKAGAVLFSVAHDALVWPLDCVSVSRVSERLPDATREPELHASVMAAFQQVKLQRPGLATPQAYRNALLASDGSSASVDFGQSLDGCAWIAVLREKPELPKTADGRALVLNVGFSPAPTTPTLEQIAACPGVGAGHSPSLEWRASLALLGTDGSPRYVPVRAISDTSAGFTKQGVVRVELPSDLSTLGVPVPTVATLAGTGEFPPLLDDKRAEQVWFWLRVWRTDQSRIGETRLICLNALSAEQFVEAAPELLGSGSGQPGQAFQLAHQPVLSDAANPVRLQVLEAGSWTDWTAVPDFDASGASDRHFVVDAEAGIVRFGERFPEVGESVRVTGYRWGGGSAGNLPAQALSKLGETMLGPTPAPPLVRADPGLLKVSNPFRSEGGADSEPIEAALSRVPRELRRRNRAVTKSDFDELALMTPGVTLGRAECMPLFHAPDKTQPRAGTVSVVIWPRQDPAHPNAPVPDAYELRRVCEWLDTKRLITTELFVIPPTYHRIALSIAVKVKDGYGLDAVRDWVELVLRQYLAPLPPYGPDRAGWPLGRRVLGRELEGVAMQVEGVEYVERLRLAGLSPSGWVEEPVVQLAAWEVPEVSAVSVVDAVTSPPAPGDAVPPADTGPIVPLPVLREVC